MTEPTEGCMYCHSYSRMGDARCANCGHVFADAPIKKKKSRVRVICEEACKFLLVIVAVIAVRSVINQVIFPRPTIDSQLFDLASEINRNLPIMLDSETSWDNVLALNAKNIYSTHSFVNYSKEELDLDILKSEMELIAVNHVRTDPRMELFRSVQTTFTYTYKDSLGQFLFNIVVTPEMYHGAE